MTAKEKLTALRHRFQTLESRKPGWDQIARTEAIDILLEHYFGDATDLINKTDAFLAVLTDHLELEIA